MKSIHFRFPAFKALLFIVCTSFTGFGQTDTAQVVTYDVIYLKEGGMKKGNILSFDEPTGLIVFKDAYGRTYSYGREQYDYFKRDVVFPVKKKKVVVLKERKEHELDVRLGLSTTLVNLNNSFTKDNLYETGQQGRFGYLNTALKLGVGKYFGRQNYAGLNVDLGITSGLKNYFNIGAQYAYQYDSYKKNVGFYVPISASFATFKETSSYQLIDSTGTDIFGQQQLYTHNENITSAFSAVELKIGQGFAFMLNNRKSIHLEVTFSKYFVLSNTYKGVSQAPKNDYSISSFGIAAFFAL